MMGNIEIIGTGLIYRNPKPHLKSIHAFFPSVVSLGNGELLATLVLGEAFESVNCRVYLSRSTDHGKTWNLERRLTNLPPDALVSESCRISISPEGEVIAWVFNYERSNPEEGLANQGNAGFVPTRQFLYRSKDKGKRWNGTEAIKLPLVGPEFEMCCPITFLSDGIWLAPTSTWRGWNGACPDSMKAVAFVSYDKGKTWTEYMDVMDGHKNGIIFWEQKTIELDNGKLLSVAWTYDEMNKKDLCNHYAVSFNGRKFEEPKSTGLQGQTPVIWYLGKDRILTIYRRIDKPGLWANLSSLEDDRWENISEAPLWGFVSSLKKKEDEDQNIVDEFKQLKFGAPSVLCLDDGSIFVAFWCFEDCVSNIRWITFRVL
ncbi:MAG: exo-alpha-sialidase [Nitrospinae bacterium]|nr:exo-alpha-sialidase [Nitrospinota bacterium]